MRRPSWNGEVFKLLAWAWDVDLARELVGDRVDGELTPERVRATADSWLGGATPDATGFIRVDPQHAVKVDLSKPILIVRMEWDGQEAHLPIDGWHRVYRAANEGVGLRFVLLTDAEFKACDLRTGYWSGRPGNGKRKRGEPL